MNRIICGCAQLLSMVVISTCALPVWADSTEPKTVPSSTTITQADLQFFEAASQAGITEVQAAAIASRRGSSADIKAFAADMATDHQASNDELWALANLKVVKLSSELDRAHGDVIDRLEHEDAKSFDAAYANEMVRAHEAAVALFDSTIVSAGDPDVINFAKATLPKLQHHLEMARRLSGKI